MPRREGEVLRLGTAIERTPIVNMARSRGRTGIRRRGSYTQSRPSASPPTGASGDPLGLERGEGDRLSRSAIGPQDELERLEIGFAGVDGRFHYRAALHVARRRAARQTQGVAEHHHVLLGPQVEMAEPQLFVD